MERVMSVEERIRRAEEIYEKRRQGETRPITKVSVNNIQKKDIKLLKKMIVQILVCISIYLVVYAIYNNKYVFSEDFIKKANEILSYDTNFGELYENAKKNNSDLVIFDFCCCDYSTNRSIITTIENYHGKYENKPFNRDQSQDAPAFLHPLAGLRVSRLRPVGRQNDYRQSNR